MDFLEKEKQSCLDVIKHYNIKYKTNEIKKLLVLYDYLTLQLKNETANHVKLQLQEDIELLMKYICPYIE
jgi:hypothetical protein